MNFLEPTLQFRGRSIVLAIFIGGAFLAWGLMFSIQPPFYPKEAEAKGATPSQVRILVIYLYNVHQWNLNKLFQYGFVFGIIHLGAFISALIFAQIGHIIR